MFSIANDGAFPPTVSTVLFLFNTLALVALSAALVLGTMDAVRRKSRWRRWLAVFLFSLLCHTVVASFDGQATLLSSDAWKPGALASRLVFPLYLAYGLPLMLFGDLLVAGKIRIPRLSVFAVGTIVSLAMSYADPGFWRQAPAGVWSSIGFAGFCASLAMLAWSLWDGLRGSYRADPPRKGYFPFFVLVSLRFVYETAIALYFSSARFVEDAAGAPRFASVPPLLLHLHAPLFALVLGAYLLSLQLRPRAGAAARNDGLASEEFARENGLSAREIEIVRAVCQGMSTKECARTLYISEKTVNSHLYNVYRKCEVTSRAQLVARVHGFARVAGPDDGDRGGERAR